MQGWMGRVEDVYDIELQAQESLISLRIETLDRRSS